MPPLKDNSPTRKKHTREQYDKGNPKFNLLRNERRLILKALIKSNWKIKDAFKLNYPVPCITMNGYNYMILSHHISVSEKTYKKISEID